MTFEELKKANELISTVPVKGKEYAEVPQRVKAFRSVFPHGTIDTEIIRLDNDFVAMKATVKNGDELLATGTAFEERKSSFVNKTSYIENCETSAVGRALGFCGFGIDNSIASAEEVENAINQQEQKASDMPKQRQPSPAPARQAKRQSEAVDALNKPSVEKTEETVKCAMCGKSIKKDFADKSVHKYGVAVCSGECLEGWKVKTGALNG